MTCLSITRRSICLATAPSTRGSASSSTSGQARRARKPRTFASSSERDTACRTPCATSYAPRSHQEHSAFEVAENDCRTARDGSRTWSNGEKDAHVSQEEVQGD